MASLRWRAEESKLVLLLYLKKGYEWQSAISDRTPEIVSISAILRGLDFYTGPHDKSFRSKSSVRLKMANYKSIDPNYKGKSLTNVSKGDKELWTKYSDDIKGLSMECERIVAVHLSDKIKKQEKSFIEYLFEKKEDDLDVEVIKDAIKQLQILKTNIDEKKVDNTIQSLREIIQLYEEYTYKTHAGVNLKPINNTKRQKNTKKKNDSGQKKIGEYVKETFDDLIKEKKITNKIINDLMSEEWSRAVFHLGHSFLKRVDLYRDIKEQLKDENGYVRYWVTPRTIRGKEYCICKEWYENNRKYYTEWLKSFEKKFIKYDSKKLLEVLLYIKMLDESKVYIKTKDVEKKYGNEVTVVLDYLIERGVLSVYQDDRNLVIVDDYDLLYKMIANSDLFVKEGKRR